MVVKESQLVGASNQRPGGGTSLEGTNLPGLDVSRTWRVLGGGFQRGALFVGKFHGLDQAVKGCFMGRAVDSSFQCANGIFPNARALRQFGLRQPSCTAVVTEQRTKI
jgi:hypothetical protein